MEGAWRCSAAIPLSPRLPWPRQLRIRRLPAGEGEGKRAPSLSRDLREGWGIFFGFGFFGGFFFGPVGGRGGEGDGNEDGVWTTQIPESSPKYISVPRGEF